MKKLIVFFSVASLLVLASCSNKGGTSAAAKKNLESHQAVMKMFNTGDFSKFTDYLTADAVDHAGEHGDVKGADNIKAELEKMMAMVSDMKNEAVKEMADDDYVMGWYKESGTMKTEGMGMKAGDKFAWDVVEVTKFKDGKATDHWSFMNMADMMKMMPPPPTTGNMMDTTKPK